MDYPLLVDNRRIFDYTFKSIKYEYSPERKLKGQKIQTPVKFSENVNNSIESNYYCIPQNFILGESRVDKTIHIPVAYIIPCDFESEKKYNVK